MEACIAVEREIDKVLTKFGGINDHAERVLQDITNHIESLKNELNECKFNCVLFGFTLLFYGIVYFFT